MHCSTARFPSEDDCTTFARSDAYAFDIQTLTDGGIIFAAVAMGPRDHVSENGSIERAQTAHGTGLDVASLAISDRAVNASTHKLGGRFDADAAWAVVSLEIRSRIVPDDKRRFTNVLDARPNPFNAGLALEFTLFRRSRVVLRVYDASGRTVRHLLNDIQPPGRIIRHWDTKDDSGRTVGSGVYFVRMDLEGHMLTRKVVLLK